VSSNRWRAFALVLLSGAASSLSLVPVCLADHYPRQASIDAVHYTFRLTLRDETDEITGEATVLIRFVDGGQTSFALDLASLEGAKGMVVTAVKSMGQPARYEHKDSRLRITLEAPPKAGERRAFTISYHGVPASGLRIGKNLHGERTFFSQNWPDRARQWLPMVDHPYDKATSEFLIDAPAHYQVIANGLLEEEVDSADGRRLTHWQQSVPIASWLNAIGVARFAVHHAGIVKGVPLQSWVFPQDGEPVISALEQPGRRVLEFYSGHVGPYAYEKLAGVQAAGLGGGTEHASAIFYGERNLTGRGVTNLVAHEVAHQWFGNAVTEHDWDDVWLSEGFATYFTLLFVEHDSGRDAFVAGLKRSREIVFATESRNPSLAVIHDNIVDMRRVLNQLVYQKGGWVLHMLRGEVGTDKFWSGIRDYYARYRDRNASTDDFRSTMEESSGKDLAWFFEQWLKRAGSPALEGSWRFDQAQKRLEIDLSQAQPGDPFRLPLEIGIVAETGVQPRVERIELKEKKHHWEIPLEKAPVSVTLDPNCWALVKTKFTQNSTSLAPVTPPPVSLGLDQFYAKYVSAHDLPIVGSAKVSDHALREAAYLVDQMLVHRPEIRDALIKNKIRVAVMAYSERTTDIPEHRNLKPKLYWDIRARGLGASREAPVVSCAEENLLNYRGDPYSTENILIHEFGHGIQGVGLRAVDPTFGTRLRDAYKAAMAKGLWKGTYAATNPGEYWAEAVQSWFDTNRQNDSQHNHVDTRDELKAYDPELAKLCQEVFGDGEWRYVRPDRRTAKEHLAGFDPAQAPKFQWEPELLEARRKHHEEVKKKKDEDRAAAAKRKE
jgi:aminopeptidase N